MVVSILLWGAVAGVIHFMVLGALYGNPIIDRMYVHAAETSSAVKRWPSKPKYMLTQFLGTQVEVYIIAAAFFWLRPLIGMTGLGGAMTLGLLLAALRVYPRFWNMWIQTTYPNRLLAVEAINGTLGTLAIVTALELLAKS